MEVNLGPYPDPMKSRHVAEIMQARRETVSRWTQAGKFGPVVRPGKDYFYPKVRLAAKLRELGFTVVSDD